MTKTRILTKIAKSLKKLKNFFLHKAMVLTVASALTFIIPTLLDVYLRKNYDFSFEKQQFVTIGFSIFIIFLNILIVRKWLSFKQVGLQRSGFLRAFIYSLVFVFLLRITNYFGYKEVFPKEVWTKQFFLQVVPFIFLAFQEELMFRGIIFKVWERRKGLLIALFISSVLFGLEHLVYPTLGFEKVTLNRAVSTAFWGPVFVLIAYRTKNIWGLSISHFLYNISLLASEEANQFAAPINSFIMLAAGLYIFFPIILDKINQMIDRVRKKDIVWSRYLALLLILFFTLFAGEYIMEDFSGVKKTKEFCPVIEDEEVKKCTEEALLPDKDCFGIDLRLEEAGKEVRGNKRAIELLEKNCLWLFNTQFHDLTGDKEDELIMITSGAGCASCHWNRIYILSEDKIIFQKDVEDVWFWPAENYFGFIIKYPLRREDEAYCCPTEGIVESYTVSSINSGYETFYKFDERSEPYQK